MSFIVSSFLVFYIFFAFQGRTLATANGYIVFELEKIVCKNSSSAISECSGLLEYDIPDLRNVSFPANFSRLFDHINNTIKPSLVFYHSNTSGECRKTLTTWYCNLAYPFQCKEDYIDFLDVKALSKCSDWKNACSDQLSFNCSLIPDNNNTQYKPPKIPLTLKCEKFPDLKDDPYICITNYKVGQNVHSIIEILIYIPV